MDAFSDSYHIVLYTLSLYDYRIAEFGTLLGKNMYHMIRTNVKAIIKRQEIPIDCVPPSLLKDSANFENIEEEIASLIEDNFTVGSDEYIVGKMMICDNHDVASIAETLKKPNSIIASIKKMIVRKLKKNPKAMTIIRELTDKK
jgi:hypothetical protein